MTRRDIFKRALAAPLAAAIPPRPEVWDLHWERAPMVTIDFQGSRNTFIATRPGHEPKTGFYDPKLGFRFD